MRAARRVAHAVLRVNRSARASALIVGARAALLAAVLWPLVAAAVPPDVFGIAVLDAETARGIPLVELETVNHLRFVTDSEGMVAIREPDLEKIRVFFHVHAAGY